MVQLTVKTLTEVNLVHQHKTLVNELMEKLASLLTDEQICAHLWFSS